MKRALLSAFILMLTSITAYTQTVCTQTLRQARTVYDEGRIQELPSLLESCLKTGFADDEKTDAYRLLVLAYIYLDEPEKADNTMLELLRHNHEFEIKPQVDPSEFINLYNSFRTHPIFLWGLRLDITYTFINVINSYAPYDQNSTSGEYSPNIGIGGSFLLERGIFKKFSQRFTGRFEVNFLTSKFTHNATFLTDETESQGIVSPELIETQNWLGTSLLLQYKVLDNSWNPYITLGPSFYYLIANELSAETSVNGGEQATGTPLDLVEKEMRSNMNLMGSAGFGVKRKIGSLYFTAGARYSYGFLNITEKNYDNELTLKYGAALNDISTGVASLSLGILFQQFNPKKLTK